MKGNPMAKFPSSILHVIDTTGPGGAEMVFLDLAQYLIVDGFQNIAIIKGAGWVEDQLKSRGITYYIVKQHKGFSLGYYKSLYDIIKKHRVKLIQAHLLGSTLTYSVLSILLRLPLVATLHGRVDVSPNEKWIFIKNTLMQIGVNKLVAVSRDLAGFIAQRKLFNENKITTIYNGVNTTKFQKNSDQSVRESLCIDGDAILIGSVGNIRPAKSYSVLIDAADIMVKVHPNIHFIIAGHQKPELMSRLDAQLKALNLTDKVHFVGFQQDSAAFLGQMDMFALSSSSEGFSIATIEAMATGLPVVATRCGGPEEILAHERTGLLVPINDADALAQSLMRLLQDNSLRTILATQGKQHVSSTFSLDTMLKGYGEIYGYLLKREN
jgi:glycosyltransferase involved in cell wall biosynthesis